MFACSCENYQMYFRIANYHSIRQQQFPWAIELSVSTHAMGVGVKLGERAGSPPPLYLQGRASTPPPIILVSFPPPPPTLYIYMSFSLILSSL